MADASSSPVAPAATEVDLLVVGGGCAGMTAALVAALQGLKVLLIEKAEFVGGTTAYSAGTAWIPGTDFAAAQSIPDTLEDARRYLEWMCDSPAGALQRDAFLTSGAQAVRLLGERTDVQFFLPPNGPDYRAGPGSATAGRALVAREFDGRLLGDDLRLVRPPRPGFTVLGGMMVGRLDIDALLAPFASVKTLRHVIRILVRHARDRLSHPRGTRLVMGNALVGRLLYSLRRHGVGIETGATIAALEREEGRVSGAVVRDSTGQSRRVHARRGVVLATGGFGGNRQRRAQFLPTPDDGLSVMCPDNTGDGLDLAEAAGAAVDANDQRTGAFWMPTSARHAKGQEPILFPHIILDRAKPGLIAVDASGRRFTNEASSYHDFVCDMFARVAAQPKLAGKPAWLVCDSRFLRKYGLGLVHPHALTPGAFRRAGYLLEAPTIDALARKMEVPSDALQASVERFNTLCERGVDEDFAKGSTPLNRQNGDPSQRPNPCMAPLEAGPFHAVAVWPATLATATGVRADHDAVALDSQGRQIEGLYVVGNDMSSIMRGSYPGPGTTIGPAMVFAYRCAMHAAGRPCPPPEHGRSS